VGVQHARSTDLLSPRPYWETRLSVLSLCGQAVAYVLGILLARYLGVEGFEAYVVASAAFILLVTLVPQGLEKYSLKLLPPLLDRRELAPLRGYLRFATFRILLASLLVGIPVGIWASQSNRLSPDTRTAIVISCLSLPAGALVHLAMEVLTVFGRPTAAALVFRVAVPGVVLALVSMAMVLNLGLGAPWAIGAWGLSWCVALGLMTWQIVRAAPPALLKGEAVAEPAHWAARARPFWLYRVALAVLAQAGVVALEGLQPSVSAVGAFAAALATASIAQVLATSTNRVYASRLSMLLEHREFQGIFRLHRERLRWLALPLLAYLLITLVFARQIMGLFRPEFVEQGATALRILAASSVLSTLLSVTPTYLKHRGENQLLFRNVVFAVALQIVLLVVLVPRLGTTGAAIAYAIATGALYGNLARLARRDLRTLQST
jgi:O-antigen/teichoic acid export membrane protein